MLANWITLSRFPLLLSSVLILYLGSPPLQLAGVALLFLGLMLDTVDGMVARKTGNTSLFGSVLDIAADRTYELILWVCLADLRMIPTAIPSIVVARTTLTDALRSIGVGQGTAPFAQHRTALGRFLVGSTWMRSGYSVTKVMTFCGLALAQALSGFPPETMLSGAAPPLLAVSRVIAWLAVVLCVLRGLPVIVGSLRRYWGRGRSPDQGASLGTQRYFGEVAPTRKPNAPPSPAPIRVTLPAGALSEVQSSQRPLASNANARPPRAPTPAPIAPPFQWW